VAAAIVGTSYGVFLIVTALRLPSGAELTGQFTLQPAIKALTAVPIWWAYATSLVFITAGFFFGRTSVFSARPAA
jgi:uncharacterized membrane protein YhhN